MLNSCVSTELLWVYGGGFLVRIGYDPTPLFQRQRNIISKHGGPPVNLGGFFVPEGARYSLFELPNEVRCFAEGGGDTGSRFVERLFNTDNQGLNNVKAVVYMETIKSRIENALEDWYGKHPMVVCEDEFSDLAAEMIGNLEGVG